MSAPTIDPAALTDTFAARRMAELVDLYFQHNPPGRYQTDAADELQALAAAIRQRTGWGDAEDFDRNEVQPVTTGGAHDGYVPAGSLADAIAECAAVRAAGAATEDEWIGWPNSRRAGVTA
jgi:hypothetical protein